MQQVTMYSNSEAWTKWKMLAYLHVIALSMTGMRIKAAKQGYSHTSNQEFKFQSGICEKREEIAERSGKR